MSRLGTFLRTHKDEIGAATALLGVAIGSVGFYLTYAQLSRTEQTLRAANTYQVQKDAREIITKIMAETSFRASLKKDKIEPDNTDFTDKLWLMLNFYGSMFRQSKINGLSDDFVVAIRKDFCGFVANKAVASGWDILKSRDQLSETHEAMRASWCQNAP
jgi:hypothetical protein